MKIKNWSRTLLCKAGIIMNGVTRNTALKDACIVLLLFAVGFIALYPIFMMVMEATR